MEKGVVMAGQITLTEQEVRALVAEHTDGRGMGVLGEPGVNVLELNVAVRGAGG